MAVIVTLLLLPLFAQGQAGNLGNWLIYIGNKKIDSKWNFHHEIQYRNYNAIGDLEQLLIRTGIGYNIADKSNLLLGYGFINSQNYVGNTDEKVGINEHRIFQQFITKQSLGKVGLQHRYRFEQRFVPGNFKTRFRYFLGVTVPLTQSEESLASLYLSSYNEIFLNGEGNPFDRNRLYFGMGYKLPSGLKLEAGYMNQFLSNANRDQINLFIFHSF